MAEIFAEYAGFLASEGERETALKYIRGQGGEGAVLLDRFVEENAMLLYQTLYFTFSSRNSARVRVESTNAQTVNRTGGYIYLCSSLVARD